MKYNILLFICLFVYIINLLTVGGEENPCEAAVTCKDCLNADGICKWCAAPDYTKGKGNEQRPRCNYAEELIKNGCKDVQIEEGKVDFSKGDFGSTTQVLPKKITMKLRPGQTQKFTLSVKPAKNFPVRLYYLMDMSNSMKDDLEKLTTLGTKIANNIRNITANFQLAFGTFVDKTVTPFIQLESKDSPCAGCEPTFGYQHVFDFSTNDKAFEAAVSKQKVSGNLDTPEGGFDALMQVAVCGDRIWPANEMFRRIVVFVTDASPHIAGDGKIGGITVPNDGQCHLTQKRPNMYSKSNDMDYPSISHLKAKMKENKIVPILAVTKEVHPIYEQLKKEWKDLGTGLGLLESDSSNIVDLIRENYKDSLSINISDNTRQLLTVGQELSTNYGIMVSIADTPINNLIELRISTTVSLNDNSPDNLVVKYKVEKGCKNPEKDNECTGVAIDQKVDFEIRVTATNCPDKWQDGQKFQITVPGFGDVEVDVAFICECDCNSKGVKSSPICNKNGTFTCGVCACDKDRFGKYCECNSESQADAKLCIQPNSTTKAICSGFGSCVCGKCECNKQSDPTRIISGTYCQCNNFGCDRHEGKICGGPSRGICKCGKCVCKEAYVGENCGKPNCEIGKKKCVKDGVICSGNGNCDCDHCNCKTGYSGDFCEKDVSSSQCRNKDDCVLCHVPYKMGEKKVCDACKLNIQLVNVTDQDLPCSVYYNISCRVWFLPERDRIGNETVYVEREPRCQIIAATEAPILAIVLGIIGGIVLLGLLLLLAWKLIVTAYDQHEYHKFEKDRMKSKWENAENPIYRPSKQQFQNPAYSGNK